jgi:hypothetical protein
MSALNLRDTFAAHLAGKALETQNAYLRALAELEAWAATEHLDPVALQTIDLERFLADSARTRSTASVRLQRAAIRSLYSALEFAELINHAPASRRRFVQSSLATNTRPTRSLTSDEYTSVREDAKALGPIHSLTVCLLYETPATVAAIARLQADHVLEDPASKKIYVVLGNKPTPWAISEQAFEAISALYTGPGRLISPTTKNPNQALVRRAVEETRLRAGIHTDDLAIALKDTYKLVEHDQCQQLRIDPKTARGYQRRLLQTLASHTYSRA